MMWDNWDQVEYPHEEKDENNSNQEEKKESSHLNFDFSSLLSSPKDYYSLLELNCNATEDTIRSNYIRLALKWHPDKQKDHDSATSRFQRINEAYQVLSDPVRRREYDEKGMMRMFDYNIIVEMQEYLNHHKGLILTCNGLGIKHSLW